MKARDFCFWLQGAIEMGSFHAGCSAEQLETLRKHLALVFKHEIDPEMGDEEHQNQLNTIHNGPERPQDFVMRC